MSVHEPQLPELVHSGESLQAWPLSKGWQQQQQQHWWGYNELVLLGASWCFLRCLQGDQCLAECHCHCRMLLVSLQNADDNSYTPTAGLPVLELVTSSGAVTCLNNEAGFSQDDVDGICEVGGSKKQGKAGFTGEPAIHSWAARPPISWLARLQAC